MVRQPNTMCPLLFSYLVSPPYPYKGVVKMQQSQNNKQRRFRLKEEIKSREASHYWLYWIFGGTAK